MNARSSGLFFHNTSSSLVTQNRESSLTNGIKFLLKFEMKQALQRATAKGGLTGDEKKGTEIKDDKAKRGRNGGGWAVGGRRNGMVGDFGTRDAEGYLGKLTATLRGIGFIFQVSRCGLCLIGRQMSRNLVRSRTPFSRRPFLALVTCGYYIFDGRLSSKKK